MIEFLVPFHGDPGLAIEALQSVRAQTSDRWRVVLIDDAYPTPEVRDWIASVSDDRISYRRNETTLGVLGNFRTALALASAEWVCFLGCDDRLRPGYVERMLDLSEDAGADVIHPGVAVIDRSGVSHVPRADALKRRISPAPGLLAGEPLVRSLMHGNWTYFPAMVWRRQAVQLCGFRDYGVVLDLGLLVDVALRGGAVRLDDRVTFEYRRHASSVSSATARTGTRFDEERRYLTQIAAELTARGWGSAARAARLRWTSRAHAVSLAPEAMAALDWGAVRELLRHGAGT